MQNPKLLFHPKCSPKTHKASRAKKTNKKITSGDPGISHIKGPRDLRRDGRCRLIIKPSCFPVHRR